MTTILGRNGAASSPPRNRKSIFWALFLAANVGWFFYERGLPRIPAATPAAPAVAPVRAAEGETAELQELQQKLNAEGQVLQALNARMSSATRVYGLPPARLRHRFRMEMEAHSSRALSLARREVELGRRLYAQGEISREQLESSEETLEEFETVYSQASRAMRESEKF